MQGSKFANRVVIVSLSASTGILSAGCAAGEFVDSASSESSADAATYADSGEATVDAGIGGSSPKVDGGRDAAAPPSTGTPLGGACSSNSECASGLCSYGACHASCSSEGSTCPAASGGGVCTGTYCTINCSLTSAAGACPGTACIPLASGGTDCWATGGTGTQGASCNAKASVTNNGGCAAGYGCIGSGLGSQGECLEWCTSNSGCSGGATCDGITSFTTSAGSYSGTFNACL